MRMRDSRINWKWHWFLRAGVALLMLGALSCGGGGSTTPRQLSCTSGTSVGPGTVALKCGGATDASTANVDVILGGPSSGSMTVVGFNFDITYAPSDLAFVAATSYTSALLPDALVGVALYNGQQGRVVVSVQEPGGLAAVSVDAGEHKILSLSFRRVQGATFSAAPLAFENAEATGASAALTFSSDLSLAYQ